MAMSGGKDDGQPMMEMNTTPLIDVMLVLLIMFIITIPPVTHAVKIDLPVDTGQNPPPPPIDPIVNKVFITPDNVIMWNGTPVTVKQMELYLRQTRSMQPEPELQFQPSPTTRYVIVDMALAAVKRSGITKFGFVGNEFYGSFGKASRPPN